MATPAFVRLIREWNAAVSAVVRVVGSRERALAAVEGIKLQEHYGVCFASYRFLGKRGGLSNKAIQRMMDQLEEAGLIRRKRIIRANQTQGTYVVDWGGLWQRVAAALDKLARERSRPGEYERLLAEGRLGEAWDLKRSTHTDAELLAEMRHPPPG